MSTIKSVGSLTDVLKVKPKISRKHLSRYSWLPDLLRVEGSIATKIFGPVLTVTLFASGIAYAWHNGHNVTLSNSVTPLLAVVVGLILVFRNSTSYDRYYEGRKDFGAMVSNIRNLTRLIWISVAIPEISDGVSKGKAPIPATSLTPEGLRKRKIEAIKLCVAFAYAVKHALRQEHGFNYDDYEGVLPHCMLRYDEFGYDTSRSPTSGNGSYKAVDSLSRNASRRKSDMSGNEDGKRTELGRGFHLHSGSVSISQHDPQTPLLGDTYRTVEFHSNYGRSLGMPLLIAHELSRLIFRFKRDGFLETVGPAGTNAMNTLVQGMVTQLTNMERVANTPIPVSYSIHLKQCVSLYLFSLPFTLVRDLDWRMIPVVTVVAFTLMGIEGIADEIEMPFGNDKSDLPLDQFCQELREEIDYMIERLPEGGEGMHGFDDGEGDD